MNTISQTPAAPSSPSRRRYLVEEQPRPPRRPRTPWMITTPKAADSPACQPPKQTARSEAHTRRR